MNAHVLIAEAAELGCRLVADDTGVLLRGDPIKVAELVPRLRPYKTALLTILRERERVERKAWRIHIPGRPAFGLICVQGCTRDELLARYPAGTRAEAVR